MANKPTNKTPSKAASSPAANTQSKPPGKKTAVPDVVKLHRLRRFNLIMGALHLIQGILMLVLSSAFALPVYSSFLVFNASTQKLVPTPEIMFNLRLGPMMAAFLFLSALAIFLTAATVVERIAAHESTCSCSRSSQAGHLATCFSARWISTAESSRKA